MIRNSPPSKVWDRGEHRGDSNCGRIDFLGIPLDNCTLEQAVALVTTAMRSRTRLQHGDVNVAKFVAFRTDAELHRCTAESDLICADGMAIVWGGRLLGLPLPERVTGIDLMVAVLDVCNREGFRPYFLGARQDVVLETVRRIQLSYPNVQIAGSRNGYFRKEDEPGIVADIKAARADCLFVGMSSPLKETFLNRYRDLLGVPVQIGVGGSFDVLAGHVRRAPRWVQSVGLEWFFRLSQEPGRLWRRYLTTNTQFCGILMLAVARRAGQRCSAWLSR
jgi:N-acetylglucosaminyldiphosphoundecaprenol N-acetyl-beta-D-mannosaminyltransferase